MASLSIDDFATPNIVFQIGDDPVRIDILTQITGVDFDEASASAMSANYGDISTKILSVQMLIKNKTTAGRPQDLVDVDTLKNA